MKTGRMFGIYWFHPQLRLEESSIIPKRLCLRNLVFANLLRLGIILFFVLMGISFTLAQEDLSGLTATLNQLGEINPNDKEMLLSSLTGGAGASGFTLAKIMAWILFGGVGFVAFSYGKSQKNFKPLGIGLVLMIYPYFTNSTLWLYIIGLALSAGLYFGRD